MNVPVARRIAEQRGAQRIDLVDALRAFALAGILQVNIQSFVWGAGDPLGYFLQPPSLADAMIHVLIGALVSTKFLSIFAFLFGLGFALQMRGLRRREKRHTPDGDDARRTYRRRLAFLLAVGLAHGTLLYYGDILAFYALGGYILLLYAGARPAQLARAVRNWWVVAAVWMLGWLAVNEFSRVLAPLEVDPTRIPDSALVRLATYTQGDFLQQVGLRTSDFLTVLATVVAVSIPQIVGLFLLGALAGRLGWLARPERHRRVWRAATWIGIAATPFALAGAWMNFETMRDFPGDPGLVGYALQLIGSAMACLYVALIVRAAERPGMQRAIAWLAPAGRMPLSNYLLQSGAMGVLLSGWGLGLGAELGRVQLAALGLVIVALQLAASRAWIERFGQGPVEAAWRAWTYRGAPPASSTFSQTPR